MHNIGKTVREAYETPGNEFEAAQFGQEFQEMPNEFEAGGPAGEWEFEQNELPAETFSPELEMALAAELLEVQNEAELDRFLSKLMKKGGGEQFAKSDSGKKVGGFLKNLAKKALPIAGRLAGGFFGGPLGAKIGGQIGQFASRAFGQELEGMSGEDREFALSRAFVRFGGNSIRNAVRNRHWRSRPAATSRAAIYQAARRFAPGLLYPSYPPYYPQQNYVIADDGVSTYNPDDYYETAL